MSTLHEKLLDELVDIAVKEGASDLHLAEGRTPVIRVSNFLIPMVKMAGEVAGSLPFSRE